MSAAHGLRGSVPDFLPYVVRECRTGGYVCSTRTEKQAEAICHRLFREKDRHYFWALEGT